MSFFLTDEQEDELNLFLDEENKKICEEQLSSGALPDSLAEIVQKTVDAGSPIPAFDPAVGYYTISFTPSNAGNRIYAHHHLSNKSVAISDPMEELKVTIDDESDGTSVTFEEPTDGEIKFVEDYYDESSEQFDSYNIEINGPPDNMTFNDIVNNFGPPPEDLIEDMGMEKLEDLIKLENETTENQ